MDEIKTMEEEKSCGNVKEQGSKKQDIQGRGGEEKRKDKKEGIRWSQVFVNLLLFLVILGGYHYYLVNYVVPRIKVFDLVGSLGVIQNLYVSGRMSENDLRAILDDLKVFLEKESAGRNVYVLPSQMVLNKEKIGELRFENTRLTQILEQYQADIQAQMQSQMNRQSQDSSRLEQNQGQQGLNVRP